MLIKLFNKKKCNKGFTLIELLLVLPFISIIFFLAYNMTFMIHKSFHSTKESFSNYEDIRIFQLNIQKEANQARKAGEEIVTIGKEKKDIMDVMKKISDKEIHIYTDIDEDQIPEIVRYRLEDNKILRDIKKTTSKAYPYKYTGGWLDEKVVLKNVKDVKFVNEIENVKEKDINLINQSSKDYRKKTTLYLEINTQNKDKAINLQTLLVTKSRAEAN
jgi:prepilin-type N-terminal cleavage/methylation domain-containing protein